MAARLGVYAYHERRAANKCGMYRTVSGDVSEVSTDHSSRSEAVAMASGLSTSPTSVNATGTPVR